MSQANPRMGLDLPAQGEVTYRYGSAFAKST